MSGEKKESSVLFTLKELKDITSEDSSAAPAARPKPAPARAAKKKSSLTDDADSLLADLLGDVGADAEAEAARIEAERQATAAAAEQEIMRTAAAQQAEIQARIEAEQARRAAAAEERESRRRAIDIAERRARGEIIPEDEPPKPVVTRTPAAPVPSPAQPEPPAGRSTGFYLTVVGLPVLCLTAVALVIILKPVEQPAPAAPPPTEVVTVVETPKAPAVAPVAVVDDDFEPDVGVADAAVPDAGDKVATAKKKKKRRRKSSKKATAAKKTEEKKKGGLKLDLGGGSGITF